MIQLVQFPWSPFCIVQRRILEYSGARFTIVNIPNGERSLVCVLLTFTVAYTAAWLLPSVWAVGPALALTGCAGVTWDVVVVVLRQTLIPQHLLGRVNSVYRLVAWGAMPVGAAVAGVVAKTAGTVAVFGAGAGVMAVVTVLLALRARGGRFATPEAAV